MNLEQSFIYSNDLTFILSQIPLIISEKISNQKLLKLVIPNSRELILQNKKRKIAISNPINDWISIVESGVYNDYELLLKLSEVCSTKILGIDIYNSCDEMGFVVFDKGNIDQQKQINFNEISHKYFYEEEYILEIFKRNNIPKQFWMKYFKDIVKDKGWNILSV